MKTISEKIYEKEVLLPILAKEKEKGHQIILTNGCFDIFHIGHLECLLGAKQLGGKLVVALNSDLSLKRIKKREPIFLDIHRAKLIAALSCVDYVFIFDEDSFELHLKSIRPNIYVKGVDYSNKTTPEQSMAEDLNIRYEIIGEQKVQSSSEIIRRLRSEY